MLGILSCGISYDFSRFLRDADGYSNWPSGRGIFINKDKTFLVWVNEEDHLRLISMQNGGDLAAVYKRLCKVTFKVMSDRNPDLKVHSHGSIRRNDASHRTV